MRWAACHLELPSSSRAGLQRTRGDGQEENLETNKRRGRDGKRESGPAPVVGPSIGGQGKDEAGVDMARLDAVRES